ncbi:DMT family transporter [Halopseudomonas sp.]|uniref:DMT family transporter n=1 Tax=Halopseudomonas sp. TaxID=2901191 RepID=UPI003002EB6D
MSGKTVNSAIALLVIGNALALISDVFIKFLEQGAPVFQYALMRCVITLLVLLPFWRQIDTGKLFEGGGLHFVRGHVHLVGIVCMVYALVALPLATANAVFYIAPILVMILSVIFFGERLTSLSLAAVISGFAGILVILRPVEFSWAALGALGSAAALAVNAVLVRKLPARQSTAHKLLLNYLMIIPACLGLAVWEGAPWSNAVFVSALGSSVFILAYNVCVLMAYKHVAANQVTSAEYTGLIWAVLIGWLFFAEVPDLWFLFGSAMIVVPLLLIGLQQRRLRTRPANHELADTRYHATSVSSEAAVATSHGGEAGAAR